MKLLPSIITLSLFVSCITNESQISADSKENTTEIITDKEQTAEPFALLELYTSEGCSDCPAAEALLNDIALEAWADRSYICALSFHVDYWNKLGWKDEFSQSMFSDRQRAYRKVFGNEVVYTPQMIVNGTREFVGSDKDKTTSAIEDALKHTPQAYFTITPNENWLEIEINPISMNSAIADSVENYELNICIVERGLITHVIRGENKGKELAHENIVRWMSTNPLSNIRAKYMIDYYAGFDENFSIVCFIQHKQSLGIVGATIWNY